MKVYGEKQFSYGKGVEFDRLKQADKALRKAIAKTLADYGFDPVRLQTKLTIIRCKEKDCSECGLKQLCKQIEFKDNIIQIEVRGQALDRG